MFYVFASWLGRQALCQVLAPLDDPVRAQPDVDLGFGVRLKVLEFLFIAGSMALSVLAFRTARWLTNGSDEWETKEFALSMIFRVSAIHALIVGLVFAQETVNMGKLNDFEAAEAGAVASLFYDAGRISDEERGLRIQNSMVAYLAGAACEEWEQLGSGGTLSNEVWDHRVDAYLSVLDFEPQSRRDEFLQERMIIDAEVIEEKRNGRAASAESSITALFWIPAFLGLIVISGLYGAFPVKRAHLTLVAVFGAFNGVILLMIYSLANPYAEPGGLSPTHLRAVVKANPTLMNDPRLACLTE